VSHLIWSNRAIADLNRLRKFLKVKDSEAGRRAVAAIRARVRILDQYPQIGRPAEFSGKDSREWTIRFGSSGYVVRYQAEDGLVTILAVRHMREGGFADDAA
jgi:plasmid stabilization system protein ParE